MAPEADINWGAVFGVIAGAVAGNFISRGIESINAMIVACIFFYAYTKIIKRQSEE